MSHTQSLHSRAHTPNGAAIQDNRSFANLRMELDEDVDLLKYLAFNRATFQPQNELYGASDHRLLYGDMMEEKDRLWIYFTLLGGGQNFNKETGGNRMLTFHTLKGAQNGDSPIRPQMIQKAALASAPFKLAHDCYQIMAIAKYFFVKRGVDKGLQTPISVRSFKSDLLLACKEYKAAFERQETRKAVAGTAVAAAGTHRGASSRDPSRSISKQTERTHNPDSYTNDAQQLYRYSPSPTTNQLKRLASGHLDSQGRDAMVEKYIALQTQEEELDRKISEAEGERSDMAAQMVGLQARLDAANNNKCALMEEKGRTRVEKKHLQSSLELDEQMEFGFEAGRKMENKRLKRD